MKVVGVISDTHLPKFKHLPEELWQLFEGVEMIIHAGDLSVLSVLADLDTLAPVVAVQGNVEREEVVMKLPIKREVVVGNCRIGIVHILDGSKERAKAAKREFPNARVVIFGHSHIPYNQEHDGQLLVNPGSATDRRSQPHCSVAKLYIDEESGQVRAEIIPLMGMAPGETHHYGAF